MKKTTLLLMAVIALVGCGDDGGSGGGQGDGDPGDPDDGTGDSSGDPTGTGGDPSGSAAGDPDPSSSSGDPGSGTTSGGATGVTCGAIWECYEDCSDIDCTTACYEQGSDDAKALDDDLWTCIFENDCNDGNCIDQMCSAQKQACLDQG